MFDERAESLNPQVFCPLFDRTAFFPKTGRNSDNTVRISVPHLCADITLLIFVQRRLRGPLPEQHGGSGSRGARFNPITTLVLNH